MKTSYYDGGHRVPFFIRWPNGGLDGGRDVEDTSYHVDFFQLWRIYAAFQCRRSSWMASA